MVKRDASGKKGKLLCCKRIFNQINANLVEIQQNVQKSTFFAKSSRNQWVNWLSKTAKCLGSKSANEPIHVFVIKF